MEELYRCQLTAKYWRWATLLVMRVASTQVRLPSTYAYDAETDSWEQIGESLPGEVSGDLFGSSLSISEDGKRIAVGAPWKRCQRSTFGQRERLSAGMIRRLKTKEGRQPSYILGYIVFFT